jgi:hypothetical protein
MKCSVTWAGLPSSPFLPGTSSGLISVSSTFTSTSEPPSLPSWLVSATQRTRCEIRVLGTLAFTL